MTTQTIDRRRIIVCLCGSTRFKDAFLEAQKRETLSGKIVLSVGWFGHSENKEETARAKPDLDELHLDKIAMSDEVLILNIEGYIGESTQREVAYAYFLGKDVRWHDRMLGEQYVIRCRHELGRHVAGFMERDRRILHG